ncbi:carbohydrate ABC transporter permease [Paenibacillus puldeungensis]|uniref:Carbohydrate ABC transporter permease n=1 Tax=Paenibacillus puldeungensis TaxID=696536 RepID=A0ABW3RWB3_9BACL
MGNRKMWRKLPLTCLMLLIALVILFPIGITIVNSLMTEKEIVSNYGMIGQMDNVEEGRNEFVNLKLIPDWVSLEQYNRILIETPKYMLLFWNSVRMVVPILIGQTAVAALAAYALAILRFPGRDKLFVLYLLTMLMPFQVTLVPNYMMADRLGLIGSESSIVLPGIFSAFGVFLLRQFMLHIPYAYIEAAKIDGAGQFRIFSQIVIPLVKPGLAALQVLLFVDYWNMVEQPLIFLDEMYKQPLSVFLQTINEGDKGVAFAASVLYMTPMVLLFLDAESYLIEGVQLSGVKG